MARKTRTQLDTEANIIKNETIVAANTATRVGTMYLSDIESEVNWEDDVEHTLTNDALKVPASDAVFNAIGAIPTPTLNDVLVAGNETLGTNIKVNDADAIELENTSLLKKGTYDFGASGGISRICSVGYEDMWQAGIHHVFDNNGFIRESNNCFNIVPDGSFDNTLRFKVGSRWILDDGTVYVCSDASTGTAVWAISGVNLQSVTDGAGNNETTNPLIVGVVGTEHTEYNSFDITYNLNPFKTILSCVHPSSVNFVNIQDGSGTLAFLSDIPTPNTDTSFITNIIKSNLAYNILYSLVEPKTMYRITDATGGVVRVWGVSINTISAAAFQEGSWDGTTLIGGAWGTYNLSTDTFTAISGGSLTAASFYTFIDSLSTIAAATVDNADYVNISDVSATLQKKISWSNFKIALQLSFDNIYQAILTATNMHTFVDSLTAMTTPVDADKMLIVDNSTSLAKKITWANIKATLKTYFDSLYLVGNTAITGATKTKITYDSKGLVTSGADATTADIADSTNKRYVTDAQQTVIGNTSGTNSGNETTTTTGALINGATAKTTPVDADFIGLMDSAASNILKKLSWLNVKATLKTYFDTLYQAVGTYLVASNNLSDLTNTSTARTNLKMLDVYITTGDQTTSVVTASSITGLSWSAVANKRYKVSGIFHVGCSGVGGIKIQVTIPTGATMFVYGVGIRDVNGQLIQQIAHITSATLSALAFCTVVTTAGYIKIDGEVQLSSTAGTVQFGFASGVATQTSTIYQLGSQLTITEI